LFLELQQLETAELSSKLSLRLCDIPKANQFRTPVAVHKAKIFLNDNHQFIKFTDTYGMLRSLADFLVRSLFFKLIIVTQLSLLQLLKKYN